MDSNELFERLYNELEDLLRIRYRLEPTASAVYYHENRVGGQTAKNLRAIRELRNYIVHDKRTDTITACIVSDEAIRFLERAIEGLKRPRRAIDVCVQKERILFAWMSSPVKPLLAAMLERNISHAPVLDDSGRILGVFSGTTLFAQAAGAESLAVGPKTTMRDFERYLPLAAHVENYLFVDRTTPLEVLIELFGATPQGGRKTKMIFVTEHGVPEERILGLITPWDILDGDVVAA